MGNPEAPSPDRSAGPVPQGTPPAEATPDGGPTSAGAPPTGHPPTSSAAPHPSRDAETAAAPSVPSDTSVAPVAESDGQGADDKDAPSGRAAQKHVIKRLQKERDDYLDQCRRVQAEFENYRKRMIRQQSEHLERAAESLIEKLLPVLDTFESAVAHGQGFEQVQASLVATLEKEGLERIHPEGKPFDPAESDAVAHEDGDGGPVVAEVLRPGYRWKGRVVRPAMVRVRG